MILGWFENVPEEEVPPEYLWADMDGLSDWWEQVKAKRRAKYGPDTVPDDEDMTSNDLGAAFKRLQE